jgi:hypothetical protein
MDMSDGRQVIDDLNASFIKCRGVCENIWPKSAWHVTYVKKYGYFCAPCAMRTDQWRQGVFFR